MTIATLVFLVANPLHKDWAQRAFPALLTDTSAPPIHTQLANPIVLEEPDKPKNLIILYLEGLEATYGEREVFGNIYAPLTALQTRALVFDNIRQLPLTSWSTAGLIASQCGLPSVPRGFSSHNDLGGHGSFMPSRVCLGDILSARGYETAIFIGNDPEFGGVRQFELAHGFEYVTGLDDLRHRDPGEVTEWGMHDAIVYQAAFEEITRLAQDPRPYAAAVVANGPHGVDAFISRQCRTVGESGVTRDTTKAVACLAGLTKQFVERLEAVVDMENTLVLVLSDHLAHPSVAPTPRLNQFERRNTAFVLGAGINPSVISKPGSMIDIYPTLLELLGFRISGHHAGLGKSLLSDLSGLETQKGRASLEARLLHDTKLMRMIWGTGETP